MNASDFADLLDIPAIEAALDDVTVAMSETLVGSAELVVPATRMLNGGGKRLRPLLTIASSVAADPSTSIDPLDARVRSGAAAVELVHVGSLVHDDIIDGADTRRGRASVNRVFGNPKSVLYGDYLYIRSMNMALKARKLRIIDVLAEATERMIEGEILAQDIRGCADVTREQHLQIVERKTAWLFSGCCRAAAVLAGAHARHEHQLARYGMALGSAFQLVDDALDYSADSGELGKNVGDDLAEGKPTMPLIRALEVGDADQAALIRSAIESDTPPDFDAIHTAIVATGALQYTIDQAQSHARRARAALDGLDGDACVDALAFLADYAVSRTH